MKTIVTVMALLSGNAPMSDPAARSVTMTATRSGAQVVVTLVGRSAEPQTVRYTLTVTGASTTRHAGRTRLDDTRRIMSQVSVSASTRGRAVLEVVEHDTISYRDIIAF